MAGSSRERRGALVLVLGTMLLAAGVWLSEDPALAAAARAVRTRPVEHAAAVASWAAQALWSGPTDERVARMAHDCEGRRWQ